MRIPLPNYCALFACLLCLSAFAEDGLLFHNSDFEKGDLTNWMPEGEAFKSQPTKGDNLNARNAGMAKHQGNYWIGTYENTKADAKNTGNIQGDKPRGKLRSVDFAVKGKYLTFLIGGGQNSDSLFVNILVGKKSVAKITGTNRETMQRVAVDMRDYASQTAHIEIVDDASGSWGHLNVDDFRWSNDDENLVILSREILADKNYLLIPVGNPPQKIAASPLTISADGNPVQTLKLVIPESDESIAFWCAYPIEDLKGKKLTLTAERIASKKKAMFARICTADSIPSMPDEYREPYRDHFHFTPRYGWSSDINGIYYRDGVWHLFYQYNPVGIYWLNMHWGHATSTDLIHWREQDIALKQNGLNDMMFSGTGFVDGENRSALAPTEKGPDFIAFTSTGRGECLAYSLDGGKKWREIEDNPILKHDGRDPQIFWHGPTQKWVMVVYAMQKDGFPDIPVPHRMRRDGIRIKPGWKGSHFAIYTSDNLKNWTLQSQFVMPDRSTVYECPQLIEMPVQNEPGRSKWVLFGVMQYYYIGEFDGKTFIPDTEYSLTGIDGFCRAALTFANAPKRRRILMGWVPRNWFDIRQRWPNARVSQGITLPIELTLRRTPDGLRMYGYPVAEMNALRLSPLIDLQHPTFAQAKTALEALNGNHARPLDIVIEYDRNNDGKLALSESGIAMDTRGGTPIQNDKQPFTPAHTGELRMLVDTTIIESYLDYGRRACVQNKPKEKIGTTELSLEKSGDVHIRSLKVFPMRSIWEKTAFCR